MSTESSFESAVLAWVSRNYETAHTIAEDLTREMNRRVSEKDVWTTLLELSRSDLVRAYVRDARLDTYTPLPRQAPDILGSAWFRATTSSERAAEGHP